MLEMKQHKRQKKEPYTVPRVSVETKGSCVAMFSRRILLHSKATSLPKLFFVQQLHLHHTPFQLAVWWLGRFSIGEYVPQGWSIPADVSSLVFLVLFFVQTCSNMSSWSLRHTQFLWTHFLLINFCAFSCLHAIINNAFFFSPHLFFFCFQAFLISLPLLSLRYCCYCSSICGLFPFLSRLIDFLSLYRCLAFLSMRPSTLYLLLYCSI